MQSATQSKQQLQQQHHPYTVAEPGEKTIFQIHSYRSGITDNDKASSNVCTVLESIPDTHIEEELSNKNFTVHVKKIRKAQPARRIPAQKNQMMLNNQQKGLTKMVTPKDAVYEGTASSPHIKPEYLKARIRNSAFLMRARSIGPNQLPGVQGLAITQPLPIFEPQHSTTIKADDEKKEVVEDTQKDQKLQEFKKAVSRHQHYQQQQKKHQRQSQTHQSSKSRSQCSNDINLDIANVDIKKQPFMNARGETRKRPATQPHIETLQTTDGGVYVSESNFASYPHQMLVKMAKERRSEMETPASGGSALMVSTVYDTSPDRLLMQQQSSATSPKGQAYQAIKRHSNGNRDQMKRRGENIRADSKEMHYRKKLQSSHVQLTEFLANHKIQGQLTIKMGDQPAQQAIGNLQSQKQKQQEIVSAQQSLELDMDPGSAQSQDFGAKIHDYQKVSPQILLPKLGVNLNMLNVIGEQISLDNTTTAQETAAQDEIAFANMVNSATNKSELELCTQFETQNLNTTEFENLSSPINMNQGVKPGTTPFTMSQAQDRPQERDKILVQRGKLYAQLMGQSAYSISNQGAESGQLNHKHRTKSVMTTGYHHNVNRMIRVNPTEPSQPMIMQTEGFRIVAQRKQVVPNMWAEQHSLQRKRNAMSNNEIKRQQTLLNSLPLITDKNQVVKPMTRLQPDTDGNNYQPAMLKIEKVNVAAGESQNINALLQPELEPSTAIYMRTASPDSATPITLPGRLSTHEGDGAMTVVSQETTQIESNTINQAQLIKQLQQKRKEQGATTANVESRQYGGKLWQNIAWGQHAIQIGSRGFENQSSCSGEKPAGRHNNLSRVNTTHEGDQNMLNSLDGGSVLVRQTRGDRHSLEVRNNTQSQHVNTAGDAQTGGRATKQKHELPWNIDDQAAKKPMTAAETQQRGGMAAFRASRMLEFHNKLGGGVSSVNQRGKRQNCRSTAVATVKRSLRQRQRQIKDVFNLGDLRSKNLSNIKVSILNDLGTKEDGNPLIALNKIQNELEQRKLVMKTGGVQTQFLTSYNVQQKYQTAAIQDFACHDSRFNKTEVAKPGENSRMSYKKLIGRQAILLPDQLKNKQELIEKTTGEVILHKQNIDEGNESSRSATSRESFEQKFYEDMMRKMLDESKLATIPVGHTRDLDGFVTEIITPRSRSIPADGGAQKAAGAIVQVNMSENDETLLDEKSQQHSDNVGLTLARKPTMSPNCNQIKLMPNDSKSVVQRRMIDEIALKSREAVRKNRSKTQQNRSGRNKEDKQSSTQHDSQNKDMKEMLDMTTNTQRIDKDDDSLNSGQSPPRVQTKIDQAEMHTGEQQIEHLQNQDKPIKTALAQLNENYHEKLESSDVEDKSERSQLEAMGIQEQPENENAQKKHSYRVDNGATKPSQILLTQESEEVQKQKHQVFSIYEEKDTPNTRSRLDGVSSHEAFDKEKIQSQVAEANVRQSMNDDMRKLNSDEDYASPQDLHAPVINVTSVKIQKAQSNFGQQNEQKIQGRIQAKGKDIALIKHMDQSLEQQDLNSGKDTIVRHSYMQSQFQSSTNRMDTTQSPTKFTAGHDSAANTETIEKKVYAGNQKIANIPSLQQTPMQAATNTDNHLDISTLMKPKGDSAEGASHQGSQLRKSYQTNCSNDYPKMLNMISKKQETVVCVSNRDTIKQEKVNRSPNPKEATMQNDILEQLNAVNTVLAPHLINGYHQLEPKLFSTNIRASVMRHMTPLSTETPSAITQPLSANRHNTNVISGVSSPINLGKMPQAVQFTQSPDGAKDYLATSGIKSTELDEIGFVSHAAMENRLHYYRTVKQQMEQRKREYVKWVRDVEMFDKSGHGVSVISSQQFSVDKGNTSTQQQHTQQPSMIVQPLQRSTMIASTNTNENHQAEAVETTTNEVEKENMILRNVRKVEKNISKCINIEKLMCKPIEDVFPAFDELIGHQIEENADVDEKHDFTFKPKRRGLMTLNTATITQLYKDHLKYEFREHELHELLGETVDKERSNRRYFLKFTGLQIVNVDCQSGIVCDIEPISLPMCKMLNLFFLSSDQLQQLICECLRLQRVENQLKLYLDQDLLRARVHKTVPRVIREDYFSAPLQVNFIETVEGHNMIKDSFNLEIRLPRLEIVTTASEINRIHPDQPLFKTTMTHNLTGLQMMTILRKHRLLDWPDFAKNLIKERTFGFDSLQADGDASIIKFQRLDYKDDFVLYKEPVQLQQEMRIAQNLQLTMMLQERFTMHIEFLRPLYVKLQVDEKVLFDDRKADHLPGYLPDNAKNARKKTVAFMQIPFAKLPFIKLTFGDKISEGDGCFLECLYDMVELQMDTRRDILRMAIPSWRKLEEINIRQLSQMYYAEQTLMKQTQKETRKYLPKKARGTVKAILNNSSLFGASTQANHQHGSIYSQDIGSISQMQASTLEAPSRSIMQRKYGQASINITTPNEMVTASAVMQPEKRRNSADITNAHEASQLVKLKKRLSINNDMQCKLKISRLNKAVYAQDFFKAEIRCYEAHRKVPLAEFFNSNQT